MLVLARKIDESITVGDSIEISVIDIRGEQVKIGIKAPKSVKVFRSELYHDISNENKQAVLQNSKRPKLPTIKNKIDTNIST